MPIRPITPFAWQVLRGAKRSRKPLTGRQLRIAPTRISKDGTFFVKLVEQGLLTFVTGDADKPFEAVYALTEKGMHAAEYGEYEYEFKRPVAAALEARGAEVPAKPSTRGETAKGRERKK